MPPITKGIQITQLEEFLLAEADLRHGASDLTRYEGLTTTGTLVVEEDTVTGEHIVSLAVVDNDPVAIELGNG